MTCVQQGCPEPRGNACHCAGCHETFSSVTPFDLHQRLDGGKVTCLSPAYHRDRKGQLVFAQVRPGVWGRPGQNPAYATAHDENAALSGVAEGGYL